MLLEALVLKLKKSGLLSACVLLMSGLNSASAEGLASAKATVRVGDLRIVHATNRDWQTVMSSVIKTSSQKELLMNVAMECGLFTKTLVKSKTGTSDSSSANAMVKVRVLVDGVLAAPGDVTFCRRSQELTAVFGGILQSCQDLNLDGIISSEECTFTDEELTLVQDTMNANGFNFILGNVGSGAHRVDVQVSVQSGGSSQTGSFDAYATVGKGSVSIEEIRLSKDDQFAF